MDYANKGNLRGNLTKIIKNNWKQKLYMLYKIIFGHYKIHEQNLFHEDEESGKSEVHEKDEESGKNEETEKDVVYISDLGLCRPVKSSLKKDDIFGVIPFMAPEVLRAPAFAVDVPIYSYSMIMWEFTSGVSPFNDKAHDIQLCLNICRGERPEIIENTP
ncbi:hypothetical protein RhiirC2_780891 [Rhizophagus irregularis]|uniref:Protein kinase domain-containing protein n=1 Tax=Rhizophagus irregularis TaxID=588596 RepID=A0A2N1N6U9_9GLOM|nr:hypothetical protein RhiirC2_780891 [Rhizophagus irregularis]